MPDIRHFLFTFSKIIVIASIFLVTGCSYITFWQQDTSESSEINNTKTPTISTVNQYQDLPSEPFPEDTLLNLLIGELAVYGRDIKTAAENYQQEAIITRDVAVVERAAKLSRFQRNAPAALEMAKLWYEIDPENTTAAENLADMYARTNQPLEALSILESQVEKGQQANFGVIRNSKFSSDGQEIKEILDRLNILTENKNHNNFSLIFTQTLLMQKSGQNEAALHQLHKLRRFESDPVQLALIESQLMSELERDKDAADVLKKALKKRPEDNRLLTAYAQKLTKTDLTKAEKVFKSLIESSPNNTKILMSHALVAAENENNTHAKQSLNLLLEMKKEIAFANYNLGLIAEQEEHLDEAMAFFKKIKSGEHFVPATQKILGILANSNKISEAQAHLASLRTAWPLQAPNFWIMESKLLNDQGQTSKAHDVLSKAIQLFPEQKQLRFERSYLSEKLNNISLAEDDLRFILMREPDDVMAMNALGYILADRTQRYNEALDLIQRAIEQRPENAAIRDSLGWIQYKMGNIEEAIQNLELAFDTFPDDEIAAHLIEVYWQTGQKKQAQKLFKKMRKTNTDLPKIEHIMKSLQIEF